MNMKYHLLVAAAALSLGACSTDDTNSEPENEGYKISFTVAENNGTRTTLDASDFLRWVPTDKVGIYTVGKNENPNTLTVADVNQHPVEFIGVLKKLVSPGDNFYAYYPYDAAQSADPSSVQLSIPVEQKQTAAGVYNGESHPLVALPMQFQWEQDSYAGRISSVRFRQLGAIVELQLYSSNEALRSEKICSVTFESDTPLAGNFSFNLTTVADTEELPISGYESKTATTSIEEPAAIPATKDEAARIYLTIAPGTYTGQIVVKTDAAQYTFRLTEAMTFKRAAITGLPADLAETTRDNNNYYTHLCPDGKHPHLIDMGNGLKWSCCNIGATSPSEIGNYYTWGETVTKSDYSYYDNYEIQNGIRFPSDISQSDNDAAWVNSNHALRMPTQAEFQTLLSNSTFTWGTYQGTVGGFFTSKINGNMIFVPAGGWIFQGENLGKGDTGILWTSNRDPDSPFSWFMQATYNTGNPKAEIARSRYSGHNVRGVTASDQ